VRSLAAGCVAALLAAWTGSAWAQAATGDRPSEQDIFGGSAPKPVTPEPSSPPGDPEKPVAPAGPNQPPSTTPPAAAAAD